jgi:predicted murein hydrolase (TIGR00659 family)
MLVMGSYYAGVSLQKRTRIRILNPLITAMALIIPVLLLTGVEYKEFAEKTYIIHFMLGPSVVALGYILHKQIGHIRGNVGSIAAALLVGSIVGIVSVILIGKMLGSSQEVIASMQPKSVTTPIAIGISERSGGIPALTAVVVVLCGILGSVIGPWLLDKLKIKGKVARGLAMGASSHGVGTARALEMGPVEGAISGMAIGLMGVITAILIPFVEKLF